MAVRTVTLSNYLETLYRQAKETAAGQFALYRRSSDQSLPSPSAAGG